jgi:hypothetical protein
MKGNIVNNMPNPSWLAALTDNAVGRDTPEERAHDIRSVNESGRGPPTANILFRIARSELPFG